MNSTNPSIGKSSIMQGLEDAIVVGGFSALGGLIAVGYPPTWPILYGSGLAAIFAGLVAYARARQIQRV